MNLKLLNEKIKENNLTSTDIASKMGISPKTLKLKLSGESGFKVTDANRISDILNLTPEDKLNIFFDKRDTRA